MKLFVKFMLFVLVLAMAGPFIMKGRDGRALLTLDDLSLPSFDFSLSDLLPKNTTSSETETEDKVEPLIQWTDNSPRTEPDHFTPEQLIGLEIQEKDGVYYRWQDKNGVWQFSQLPNKNTENWVVRTDPNINVLQGLSEEQIDQALGRVVPESNENIITENNPFAKGEEAENEFLVPTTVPITQIPDLIKQAEGVQDIMDQRIKRLDKMTGQ